MKFKKEIITLTVFGYLILISRDFYDCISTFSPKFSIEKRHQAFETINYCYRITKHIEVRQTFSAARNVVPITSPKLARMEVKRTANNYLAYIVLECR